MPDDEEIIQEIEEMSIEEVRANLLKIGINPRPLVIYIRGLIKGVALAGGLDSAA